MQIFLCTVATKLWPKAEVLWTIAKIAPLKVKTIVIFELQMHKNIKHILYSCRKWKLGLKTQKPLLQLVSSIKH